MRTFQHPLGNFTVSDDFVISMFNEGIHITLPQVKDLFELAKSHFGDRPFVYISYRVNSYSFNPFIFKEINSFPNLKAMAVVSDKRIYKVASLFEKTFCAKEMKQFEKLDEAMAWCMSKI